MWFHLHQVALYVLTQSPYSVGLDSGEISFLSVESLAIAATAFTALPDFGHIRFELFRNLIRSAFHFASLHRQGLLECILSDQEGQIPGNPSSQDVVNKEHFKFDVKQVKETPQQSQDESH